MSPSPLRRGTRVSYRNAAGKIVLGVVLRQHPAPMADWYLLELTDEHGCFRASCHRVQITVTDNRLAERL